MSGRGAAIGLLPSAIPHGRDYVPSLPVSTVECDEIVNKIAEQRAKIRERVWGMVRSRSSSRHLRVTLWSPSISLRRLPPPDAWTNECVVATPRLATHFEYKHFTFA